MTGMPSRSLPGVPVAVDGVTKRYGDVYAVDDVSFDVHPGEVTVLVGSNGAGKSTTLRLILGLLEGEGSVTFNGRGLHDHSKPERVVGVHLGHPSAHPRRSARRHLSMLAAGTRESSRRVSDLLDLVGLSSRAAERPRGYSTGMRQRLGLASALLHDPSILVLDEPLNGLDPEGVVLLRSIVRAHAARGGSVLMASHQLDEVERVADRVLVMQAGQLVHGGSVVEVSSGRATPTLRVRSDDDDVLAGELERVGGRVVRGDALHVVGMSGREVADHARRCEVLVWELAPIERSLTEAFAEDWAPPSFEVRSVA